jgi:hypothetical protein
MRVTRMFLLGFRNSLYTGILFQGLVFKCDLDQTCQNRLCLRAVVNQESDTGPHSFKNTQKGTIECMMSVLGGTCFEGGFILAVVTLGLNIYISG